MAQFCARLWILFEAPRKQDAVAGMCGRAGKQQTNARAQSSRQAGSEFSETTVSTWPSSDTSDEMAGTLITGMPSFAGARRRRRGSLPFLFFFFFLFSNAAIRMMGSKSQSLLIRAPFVFDNTLVIRLGSHNMMDQGDHRTHACIKSWNLFAAREDKCSVYTIVRTTCGGLAEYCYPSVPFYYTYKQTNAGTPSAAKNSVERAFEPTLL
jgi:hypothetical protein